METIQFLEKQLESLNHENQDLRVNLKINKSLINELVTNSDFGEGKPIILGLQKENRHLIKMFNKMKDEKETYANEVNCSLHNLQIFEYFRTKALLLQYI